MGLAADLSYDLPRPHAFQRGVQAFASTRAGARFFSRALPPMDRAAARLTHGRTSVPRLLAALPVLRVTTTGRRSGMPRDTHLIAVPIDDTLALLGTNFGQPHTPTWVLNLEADPRATVNHRGTTRRVVARPATEAEREQVLLNSVAVYGGYLKYQQRITGRRLRIFVLEPAD
jgi:deazaflavin-dependent oxidoreductase (nitroreductase family)